MMGRRVLLVGALAVGASNLCGCEPEAPPAVSGLVRSAKFGVFYGGQVQQRQELPLILDRAKQTQGIRLEFTRPLERPMVLKWEVDVPSGSLRKDSRDRRLRQRIARLGQVTARAGMERLDQLVEVSPGDADGIWNIRAELDGQLVLDRAVLFYDPVARRRLEDERESEP
jgi:hypothetical protein